MFTSSDYKQRLLLLLLQITSVGQLLRLLRFDFNREKMHFGASAISELDHAIFGCSYFQLPRF